MYRYSETILRRFYFDSEEYYFQDCEHPMNPWKPGHRPEGSVYRFAPPETALGFAAGAYAGRCTGEPY